MTVKVKVNEYDVCLDCPFFDRTRMQDNPSEHYGICIIDNRLVYAWTYQSACRNKDIIFKARVMKKWKS